MKLRCLPHQRVPLHRASRCPAPEYDGWGTDLGAVTFGPSCYHWTCTHRNFWTAWWIGSLYPWHPQPAESEETE